jgi:dienelactone hydrolase
MRSGVNSFWTRTARSLSGLGIAVLRTDYSREGETLPLGLGVSGQVPRRDLELRLLDRILPWFRARAGGVPLHLAGSCSGARLAIELVGRRPRAFAGAFLVVPYLQTLLEAEGEPDSVDPLLVDYLRASVERVPCWVLVGENDRCDVPRLLDLLGPGNAPVVEVVPGMALHFADQPHIQRQLGRRLTGRIAYAAGTGLPECARS